MLLALLAAAAVLGVSAPGRAQGIDERLRELGAENGQLYVRPVATGLGAGMNSAWFESASTLDPLHVNLSVRAVGTVVPDDGDVYRPVLPSTLRVPESVPELGGQTYDDPYGTGNGLVTPTATGAGPGVVVEPRGRLRDDLENVAGVDPSTLALSFPPGFDIPAVPLAVLQGSVGLVAGTEATVRLVPSLEIDRDIGTLESFGVGLKHDVSQWFAGVLPVDLALAGGIQSFDAGEYLSANSRYVAAVTSKELAALTLFASGALEESDVDVTYTLDNPALPGSGTTVAFSDEGENSSRLTTGFNLDLLFLQVGATYSFSAYDVASAHVGVSF